MEPWTGLVLGLVGSLHCAGMCGPLALALPGPRHLPGRFYLGRLIYNLGRISAYALLGLVFGAVGRSVALAGFQRAASLIAGTVVLLALIPASRSWLSQPAFRTVGRLKIAFAYLLRRQSLGTSYLLGFLNGFLPCGLVYVACAGAATGSGIPSGVGYMLAFGLGTLPVMVGIGFVGRNLQQALRFRFNRLVPISVALLAGLLILRGLSLGIPYLSPDLSLASTHRCH